MELRLDPHTPASPASSGCCLLLLDLQEQGAGSTVHPQSAGNAEGGEPMAPGGAPSPGFAGV